MKRVIFGFLAAVWLAVGVLGASVMVAKPVMAAACDVTTHKFLGFRPWYQDLECEADGSVISPSWDDAQNPDDPASVQKVRLYVWTIVLNILFDLMLAVGYIATGMVIYSGYQYITSSGDPGRAAKAMRTLTSAVVGTVITMGATVIVNTVTAALGLSMSGGANQGAFTKARLQNAFSWAYAAAGIVAVMFIVKNGVTYMASRGDPSKVQKATRGLVMAVVGLLIVILASVITNVVISVVGGEL